MRNLSINRGGDDNIHGQLKFDYGWIDIDKDKQDNPATLHIVTAPTNQFGKDALNSEQANSLINALNKATVLMQEWDHFGTETTLLAWNK